MRFGAFLAVLLLAAVPPVLAQGTKADYERANNLRKMTEGKVYRAEVRPFWLPDGRRFWYRNDLADGKREFILIDPAKPEKRPAFDHARLAVALTKATGKPVDAARLPVDRIAFPTQGHMTVQVGATAYDCDLATYTLKSGAAMLGQIPAQSPEAVRRTRYDGAETGISFANRTAQPVHLRWLDGDGNQKDYGAVAAGETRQVHTYAGRAWLTVGTDGTPLAAFVATETPGLAVIAGPVLPSTAPRSPESRAIGLSPNGKFQVYCRDNNVFVRDLSAGTVVPMTEDGSPADAYAGEASWSPDSTRVVVFQTEPAQEHKVTLVESSPPGGGQPITHIIDYLKPGDRIAHPHPRLFDPATRRAIPISDALFPNPWDITDLEWDPDGKRFTFVYNERGHQALRLIAVDAATGRATALIDETSKTFLCYSSKSYLRRMPKTHEALWMSERDGWCHLYLYDTQTGQVKNQVTKGEWVVRSVDRVDEEKRQIWFQAGGIVPGQDPYYIQYCRVNFDGTGLTILTEGDGTHTATFSPGGDYLVDTYSRVDLPPVTELRRASDGKKVLDLERGDASALLATGWKYPERFVAKGRDGKTDIYGVLWRPTNFDPAKKYPVIETIYAGPQGAFVPKAFSPMYGALPLCELGFLVVQIDGMGTNYRSKAFHDVCWRNLGDAGFPDRILWMKALAAKYPCMDLTRVGIYGTSAGGQNALGGLLTHPEFYKAGVADCGCHDNRMDKIWWNEQWMGYPIGPWYAEQSNVTLAPRLQGKLLLMVGEMDTNVDPASTYQVANALIKANKDFDLLVLPGGGHGVLGTDYGRRRMYDFFVRALYGVEPRRD